MGENKASVVNLQHLIAQNSTVMDIHTILQEIEKDDNISDLHLAAGDYIALRHNGDIVRQVELPKMTNENMELILKILLEKTPENFTKFWSEKDADFGYISRQGIPYRVNAFIKRDKLALVMRKIHKESKALEDLMYKDVALTLKTSVLNKKSGLFLVTGPTGAGKSTTMIAILDQLNHTRAEHIITIEDPIEYVFQADKALISQRELERDTWSFTNALRGAMREDPDIVFVGEIRDRETAEAALTMAESGHLVFSTLHTPDAATTVSRFISFFSPDIQDSVADRLGSALLGVLSQYLVKNGDGQSRVALFELMLNTLSIRNNVSQREIAQLKNIIETSSQNGMITMQMYAQRLLEQGLVSADSVERIIHGQENSKK